jgi:hypothetical protein
MMMGIYARPKHSWLVLAGLLVLMACSGGNEAETNSADRSSAADETVSNPTPAAEVVPDSAAEPTPQLATPATEDMAPAESPAVTDETPSPVPVEEEPEAVAASEEPQDVAATQESPAESEPVVVADTKAGLTRIGATKCKMCHRVQYASWAESAHAELDPVLDCESCHGSGSEYRKKSIMEDPELAKAAGLVMPDAAFCIRCHGDDWKDEMLSRAHAHKEDGSG